MSKQELSLSESVRSVAESILEIPGATPIPRDDPNPTLYGVGVKMINNLIVIVEAYDGMAIGDVVKVYWESSDYPVDTIVVDEDVINHSLAFKLSSNLFVPGLFKPFYRVERLSGITVESKKRDIRVKLDLPGGPDPDPSTPHNENLRAPEVPDDVKENGVDKDRAARGVEITILPYLNMEQFDLIDFSWGGSRIKYAVTSNDVGKPIKFTVDEDAILNAGDGNMILEYQIIDAVNNESDHWSMTTEVEVETSDLLLSRPLVKEVTDDGILELEKLNGKPATVVIWAVDSPFKVGDFISMTWKGISASGVNINYSDRVELKKLDIVEFKVPFDSVAEITGGRASVSYQLLKEGEMPLNSKHTQLTVTGVPFKLPAPTVKEASNGVLPDDSPTATVNIQAYNGMGSGDRVAIFWEGITADGKNTYFSDDLTISSGSVGKDVKFIIREPNISLLKNGSVQIYYSVNFIEGTTEQESEHLSLSVGSMTDKLPAPKVTEAINGVLPSDSEWASVIIAAYSHMAIGDEVELKWRGDNTGVFTDSVAIGSGGINKPVTFRVFEQHIGPNTTVNVSYMVNSKDGEARSSEVLELSVGVIALPDPTIDEAKDGRLNPDDVPNGATVRISASANFQVKDDVTVALEGLGSEGSYTKRIIVQDNDVGRDLTVIVPFNVVEANIGESIKLAYKVARANGHSETSNTVVYDINQESWRNNLSVMGARTALDNLYLSRSARRYLTSLDKQTGELVAATWRYEGETEPAAVSVSSFYDKKPDKALVVTTVDSQVTLNTANICANDYAMTARRNSGDMLAWGKDNYGGKIPGNILGTKGFFSMASSHHAFAALYKRDQMTHVVAWGEGAYGGTVPDNLLSEKDFIAIAGASKAFAALRGKGHVVAWGSKGEGGEVPSEIAMLGGFVEVIGNDHAFAARRCIKDNDVEYKSVVAWGHPSFGGKIPSAIVGFDDIEEVFASEAAFAALRVTPSKERKVVAWGSSAYGGDVTSDIAMLSDIVSVAGTRSAFCALRNNGKDHKEGSVVAWGNKEYGGLIPDKVANLTDIIALTANGGAFAALRSNGSVVAWGKKDHGGVIDNSVIQSLNDVVQVTATAMAFSVLRKNGIVHAWGYKDRGGVIPDEIHQKLDNVCAVYGGGHAFAALRDDNTVITWGNKGYGGDNSSVESQLNGNISHEVDPRSRGIGLSIDEFNK